MPDGAFVGSAGGSACGDVVRVAVCVEDGRLTRVTFDAEGCGATIAAGSACVVARRGEDRARRGADLRGGDRRRSSAACRPASSTPPTSPPTRCTGRSPTRPRRHRRLAAPDPNRVLVGLSGGVDSAVAAHLCAQEGHEVVAVTLKLWADQEGDGERSCCSPQAVLGARAPGPLAWACRT